MKLNRMRLIAGFILCLCIASFAKQFLFIKGDGSWCCRTNHTQLGPEGWNWDSPVRYTHIYYRYELKEFGKLNPGEKIMIQLCMWKPNETCSGGPTFDKKGVYYFYLQRPTWCGPDNKCPNYSSGKWGYISIVHKKNKAGGGWLCCSQRYCASGTNHVCPLKYHVEAYGAEKGTFVPPDHWTGCPDLNKCPDANGNKYMADANGTCGTPTGVYFVRPESQKTQDTRCMLISRSRRAIELPASLDNAHNAALAVYDMQGVQIYHQQIYSDGAKVIPAEAIASIENGPKLGRLYAAGKQIALFRIILLP